jgi:hypothetical protein
MVRLRARSWCGCWVQDQQSSSKTLMRSFMKLKRNRVDVDEWLQEKDCGTTVNPSLSMQQNVRRILTRADNLNVPGDNNRHGVGSRG